MSFGKSVFGAKAKAPRGNFLFKCLVIRKKYIFISKFCFVLLSTLVPGMELSGKGLLATQNLCFVQRLALPPWSSLLTMINSLLSQIALILEQFTFTNLMYGGLEISQVAKLYCGTARCFTSLKLPLVNIVCPGANVIILFTAVSYDFLQ